MFNFENKTYHRSRHSRHAHNESHKSEQDDEIVLHHSYVFVEWIYVADGLCEENGGGVQQILPLYISYILLPVSHTLGLVISQFWRNRYC